MATAYPPLAPSPLTSPLPCPPPPRNIPTLLPFSLHTLTKQLTLYINEKGSFSLTNLYVILDFLLYFLSIPSLPILLPQFSSRFRIAGFNRNYALFEETRLGDTFINRVKSQEPTILLLYRARVLV